MPNSVRPNFTGPLPTKESVICTQLHQKLSEWNQGFSNRKRSSLEIVADYQEAERSWELRYIEEYLFHDFQDEHPLWVSRHPSWAVVPETKKGNHVGWLPGTGSMNKNSSQGVIAPLYCAAGGPWTPESLQGRKDKNRWAFLQLAYLWPMVAVWPSPFPKSSSHFLQFSPSQEARLNSQTWWHLSLATTQFFFPQGGQKKKWLFQQITQRHKSGKCCKFMSKFRDHSSQKTIAEITHMQRKAEQWLLC